MSIREDYSQDCYALRTVFDTWEDRENLIVGTPTDRLSRQQNSKISDSGLSTMTMERSFRVMGQLGTGVVKAYGLKDKGKAMLMDIILQRHIIPNANWGTDFLTKLRQWDFYSQVYGVMPMLYDWKVRDDGYIGPDCRLVPIRDFTPQRGRNSLNDCQYVYIDTYHSVVELEQELSKDSSKWNKDALTKVIKAAREGSVAVKTDKMSAVEKARSDYVNQGKGDAARIRIATKYWAGKKGKWQSFAPDYDDTILRDIENPHGTGKIPVIMKQSFPLIDSIYGLGDFERGESLQKAADALTNLYFDAVKMSIFRPMIVNPNGVVPHTLKYAPGARWLETIPNSIRAFETSPQGMNTFQSTVGFLKGALNNQAGTTDTMINQENSSDPSFGKTPAALQMQQARESSRDNWDRFFMEQAIEQLEEAFVCMVAERQDTPMALTLYENEIDQVRQAYPDIDEMLEISESGNTATLRISTDKIKGVTYRFYIDAGSTRAKDDKMQNQALIDAFGLFSKIPNLDQALAQQGKKADWGKWFQLIFNTAGIEDSSGLIVSLSPQEQAQMMAQQQVGAVGQSSDAAGIPNAGQQPGADVTNQVSPPQQMPIAEPVQAHGQTFTDPAVAAMAKQMFGV